MSIKIAASIFALILGSTLNAAALEGYDGDNNRIPGVTKSASAAAWSTRIPANAFAQAGVDKASRQAKWNAWADRASQVH